MRLRARWIGPPPRVGDYLMSEIRPRHAYRVERVVSAFPGVTWDSAEKSEVHLLNVFVDRVGKDAVPQHARIHPWKWDRREARAASGNVVVHTRSSMLARANAVARDLLGVNRKEAFRMLGRGELRGTLAEMQLAPLRFLLEKS